MKTYVFIAMSIAGIGGAQQYLNNKISFLKDQGWNVLVFSGMRKDIAIQELKEYGSFIIPALYYSPSFFRKGEVNRTIDSIISEIGSDNTEIIIECNSIENAKWGEMIASKMKCKSVVFNLQEAHHFTQSERAFLDFKNTRHELAGINKKSIGSMMGNAQIIPETYMVIKPYCANSVQDCDDKISPLLNKAADIIICSIGRTSKPYFDPMFRQICEYCSSHTNTVYSIVFVGPVDNATKQQYLRSAENYHNISVLFTDSVFPIPRSFIKKVDVFVSASGSATTSYLERKPTVKIHPENANVCGIIGANYFIGINTALDVIDNYSITDALEDVLEKKISIIYDEEYLKSRDIDMRIEFARQIEIARFPSPAIYYNVLSIRGAKCKKDMLYHLIGKTLGSKCLQYLHLKFRGANTLHISNE